MSVKYRNSSGGGRGADKDKDKAFESMKEELEEQKARAEAYLQQLRDGAKYVQTIQDQLDEVRFDITCYCIV